MFEGLIGTTRRARRGMLREWRLHALSVFSLAVAFVCLGAALLVLTNLRAVEERWSHAGRASIYLKENASQADIDSFKAALASVPGVSQVRYVSSGQARSDFGQEEIAKAADLAALPVEAFPASLEIEVKPDMPAADLEDMVAKIRLLPAVDDVETYQSWTERLSRLVRGGVAAAALLAVVVFASVLAVIGSTMRLALQRRKTEVEVLRLVGATDGFVKGPFLIEGSAQGALGALGRSDAVRGTVPRSARAARWRARRAGRGGPDVSSMARRARNGRRWSGARYDGGRVRPSQAGGGVSTERVAAAIILALSVALVVRSDEARADASVDEHGGTSRGSTTALSLAALDRKIADLDAEEAGDKHEIEALGEHIAEVHARVIARGRAFYRATRAGMLPLGGGFDALVEHAMKVERMRHGVAADLEAEKQLRSRAADLARTLERVARDHVALGTQRNVLDAERVAMEDESRRQQAFDRAFEISSTGSDYVPVSGGASDDYDAPSGFAASRGRLLFPVAGRAEARAAHREGTDGPGLEIRASAGSVVRAVYAGRVAFADRYGPYGKIVIVDHGAHYYSVSGNLGSVDARVGDEVTPGQRLGTVGDDGQGAMLYFEIRHGTQTVPPGPWIGLP